MPNPEVKDGELVVLNGDRSTLLRLDTKSKTSLPQDQIRELINKKIGTDKEAVFVKKFIQPAMRREDK